MTRSVEIYKLTFCLVGSFWINIMSVWSGFCHLLSMFVHFITSFLLCKVNTQVHTMLHTHTCAPSAKGNQSNGRADGCVGWFWWWRWLNLHPGPDSSCNQAGRTCKLEAGQSETQTGRLSRWTLWTGPVCGCAGVRARVCVFTNFLRFLSNTLFDHRVHYLPTCLCQRVILIRL